MNKKQVAERIRARLSKRIAFLLGCEPHELPRIKLGTLVHLAFLLAGDSEELGGFNTSMGAVLQLLGHEIVWDIEPKEESEETVPREIIN